MMPLLSAGIAALVSASGGCGLPATGRAPWTAGEVLTSQVDVPRSAATARVTLRASSGGGQMLLAGDGGLDAPLGIYRARGTARSWLDAGTLHPIRYADRIVDREGSATSTATFGRGPAVRIDWTSGKRSGVNAFVRQPGVLDALSAIYYLRAAALRPGVPVCFDLVGARKAWRVSGSVGATERVETPAGSFTAVRVTGRGVRTDRPAEVTHLQLWVSDDDRRLPVEATVDAGSGVVRARLARVETDATAP
jgi:hypothetical protein